MTEAGKKWVAELVERDEPLLTYTREYADYFIRAFIAEVEKRAQVIADELHETQCKPVGTCGECLCRLGTAFTALTRELLGGDDAK